MSDGYPVAHRSRIPRGLGLGRGTRRCSLLDRAVADARSVSQGGRASPEPESPVIQSDSADRALLHSPSRPRAWSCPMTLPRDPRDAAHYLR